MTAGAIPPKVAARAADLARQAELASVRVTGVLASHARLFTSPGGAAFIHMDLQPAHGMPYRARIDLGTDPATHLLATDDLPHLRAGVLVSVKGDGLELRQDHDKAVLRIVGARDAVAFEAAHSPTPSPTAQEANHVD
jgi:hypothetical protein